MAQSLVSSITEGAGEHNFQRTFLSQATPTSPQQDTEFHNKYNTSKLLLFIISYKCVGVGGGWTEFIDIFDQLYYLHILYSYMSYNLIILYVSLSDL